VQAYDGGVPSQFERVITIDKGSDALGKLKFCVLNVRSWDLD